MKLTDENAIMALKLGKRLTRYGLGPFVIGTKEYNPYGNLYIYSKRNELLGSYGIKVTDLNADDWEVAE